MDPRMSWLEIFAVLKIHWKYWVRWGPNSVTGTSVCVLGKCTMPTRLSLSSL